MDISVIAMGSSKVVKAAPLAGEARCGKASGALSPAVTKKPNDRHRPRPDAWLQWFRPLPKNGDIAMQKTRSKASKFLKLDKLGQRIAHAARALARQRKTRLERASERRLMLLT